MRISELIEKHKGERTFYDGELIGAYITVQNLENLCNEWLKEQVGKPVAWSWKSIHNTVGTATHNPFKNDSAELQERNKVTPLYALKGLK